MSRRRSDDDTDSLDLLLDTITNAFGGIVFLTILLVLLIRTRSPTTESQTSVQVSASKQQAYLEAEDLKQKKESLQISIAQAKENTLASKDGLQDLVKVYQELRGRISDLMQENAELLVNQEALNKKRISLKMSNEGIQLQADRLDGEIEELLKRLAREKQKRTITSSLPVEKSTKKVEIPFLCRRNRLTRVWADANRTRFSKDLVAVAAGEDADFDDGEGHRLQVSATTGANTSRQSDIDQQFSSVNRDTHYVALAVWVPLCLALIS